MIPSGSVRGCPLISRLFSALGVSLLPHARICRRGVYWPPSADKRSRLVELPSGKKFFVFLGKRDADGKLEPVVCFIDRNGDRLTWLNSEELHQLEKLAPRLISYFDLWQQKASE
ncbi:hypothetical protein BgAZ_203990 [Babesia gibsoni]|uniref:Uncharacterized protein n=1 Tax=Babesia gibsoni TaxID=33632 RepID=A0AAD8PDL9_BABGI|nr:hypothetical protein BgAZ_203990 [Babesia gibsoni]